MKNIPDEFNIHIEDERTGENCALISCRTGNIQLAMFLHKKCNADFHKLNKRSENAIQLATLGANKYPYRKYLDVIKFLIDEIGLDITYHYEETLMLSENRLIINYLEDKLECKGIQTKKRIIERENAIKSTHEENQGMSRDLYQKLTTVGKEFEFSSMFKEQLNEKSQSFVSSISQMGQSLEISSQIFGK